MAEVHVIFTLPLHLGNYPYPLAYIHWFKPLTTYDTNVKMFCLSHSTRQQLIILVNCIVQHCHLISRFLCRVISPQWTRGHALAEAEHFYLNKYIDLHTFEWYKMHIRIG